MLACAFWGLENNCPRSLSGKDPMCVVVIKGFGSGLGAAKTSAWYAVSPFVGAGLSLLIFRQTQSISFFIALAVIAAGAWFAATDGIRN